MHPNSFDHSATSQLSRAHYHPQLHHLKRQQPADDFKMSPDFNNNTDHQTPDPIYESSGIMKSRTRKCINKSRSPVDRRKRLAANARERKRMKLLNTAYEELRRRLADAENKSKYDILVQAKEYIQALTAICEQFDQQNPPSQQQQQQPPPPPPQVSQSNNNSQETIQIQYEQPQKALPNQLPSPPVAAHQNHPHIDYRLKIKTSL